MSSQSPNGSPRVDHSLLERHRNFEDEQLGVREDFLQPVIGGAETVAVLSRPLGPAHAVGWVICHSFALEQIHLGRLDVLAARQLAAAGFPVLRYHGQGYGESAGDRTSVGLSSHRRDAADAVELMLRQGGVTRVGVLGARLGGMVAALTAESLELDLLGMWEPVVRGAAFARDFIRTRLFTELVGSGQGGVTEIQHIRDELSSAGSVDINGFRLTGEAYEELSGADLTTQMQGFRGSVLLVGVSRAVRAAPALTKLQEHLVEVGADVTLQVLTHPQAAQFGHFHFQTVEGGRGKRDMQLELHEEIAATTSAWASRTVDPAMAEEGGR